MAFAPPIVLYTRTTLFDINNEFSRPKVFGAFALTYAVCGLVTGAYFGGKPLNGLSYTIGGLASAAFLNAQANEAKTNSWAHDKLRSRITATEAVCDAALWISMWFIDALKLNEAGMITTGFLLAGDLLVAAYDANRGCCKKEDSEEVPEYLPPHPSDTPEGSGEKRDGGNVVVNIHTTRDQVEGFVGK